MSSMSEVGSRGLGICGVSRWSDERTEIIRTHMHHSEDIQWPDSPVTDHIPNFLDCETLTIVHIRLRRVVTQNSDIS